MQVTTAPPYTLGKSILGKSNYFLLCPTGFVTLKSTLVFHCKGLQAGGVSALVSQQKVSSPGNLSHSSFSNQQFSIHLKNASEVPLARNSKRICNSGDTTTVLTSSLEKMLLLFEAASDENRDFMEN